MQTKVVLVAIGFVAGIAFSELFRTSEKERDVRRVGDGHATAHEPAPRSVDAAPTPRPSRPSPPAAVAQPPQLPPVPLPASTLPTRRQLIGVDGPPCVQPQSCKYFSDILVLIHLNPQRLEWTDAVLDYAASFAPNIVFFSLIYPKLYKTCGGSVPPEEFDCDGPFQPQAHRNSLMDYLYVGRRKVKVHLVDSRSQIHGDHHDLAVAMQRWPMFKGVLTWEHEDSLLSFWRLVRLPKDKVWRQPAKLKMQLGRRISWVGKLRDWKHMYPALDKLKKLSPEAAARVQPQMSPGCSAYYVPMRLREGVLSFSPIFLEVDGYNEVATPALLAAVADHRHEFLDGIDLLHSEEVLQRNKYPEQFRPSALDYVHPVRVSSDLFARILDLARRQELPQSWSPSDYGFWQKCFTCSRYPRALLRRKGSHHSCTPGCDGPPDKNVTEYHGVVRERNARGCLAPDEFEHEGFWDYKFFRKIYSRYRVINGSTDFPSQPEGGCGAFSNADTPAAPPVHQVGRRPARRKR